MIFVRIVTKSQTILKLVTGVVKWPVENVSTGKSSSVKTQSVGESCAKNVVRIMGIGCVLYAKTVPTLISILQGN